MRGSGEWRALLADAEITIEPMDSEAATRHTRRVHDQATWRRHARDAMIAGHVGEHDVLWTTNPRDFVAIGLPDDRLEAIP